MTRPEIMTTTPKAEDVAKQGIAVILNPAARSTKAARKVEHVRALASGARLAETKAGDDARRLARQFAEDGWTTVVAAGGDGTVNEVVAGLLEADVKTRPMLGVLPMGTMNVFAHELGLPLPGTTECWNRIVAGRSREVDVWRAGDHVFVQMAGVGMDAQVIRQTSWQSKKRWGPLSYLRTLTEVLDRPPSEVRLQIDGGDWLTGTTVLIGNGRFYGGPLPVFPTAANDDRLLDIALVHGHGIATFSNLVADVLLNEIDGDHEGVTRLRGRQVMIEAPSPLPFEIDGELGGETPVIFSLHSVRLRVLF